MTSADRATVRAGFVGAGAAARAHAWIRQHVAPFDEIDDLVPTSGHVLDLGCGTGLLGLQLAVASSGRTVHGVDIDERRVGVAQRAAERLGLAARVVVEPVAATWRPPADAYDAVVASDVLYLLDEASAPAVVSAACDAVRPGGTIVLKEVARTPRWKHRIGVVQELVAVRVLRVTRGSGVDPDPLVAARQAFDERAWSYRQVALDRRYPYAHAALVASRPA